VSFGKWSLLPIAYAHLVFGKAFVIKEEQRCMIAETKIEKLEMPDRVLGLLTTN
jgi:hypothetical protein